jgi:hypothetical protein
MTAGACSCLAAIAARAASSSAGALKCQYLYLCTSKASKLSTCGKLLGACGMRGFFGVHLLKER